jgi:hypothetical protein
MIYLVLTVHWIADFIFQTRSMANNKSTSMKWLSAHILAYTCFLLPFGLKFALVNGLAHFIIDFFTSRFTSYFWKEKDVHKFFITIGLDQLLHTSILIASMKFLAWSL